jgi:hypothetical protein
MTAPISEDLSELISDFRDEVASYAILMREGTNGAEAVRSSYGPLLEALQTPPPARSLDDVAAAMLYLLDFGNLGQSDEVILRAAIAGLAPILDIPDDADADFECADILPFDRPLQAHA